MTTEFLYKSIIEASPDLSRRLGNVLRNEGFQTIFAALRVTEAELLRSPNMGRKSVEEFKQYVGQHGYQLGDTANFFLLHHHDLMYQDGTKFSYAGPGEPGERPVFREKQVIDLPEADEKQIHISDYRELVRSFASSHSQSQNLTVVTGNDIEWIASLLPESARDGLAAAFERSTQLQASLGLLKQDAFNLAIKARDFGRT